MVAGAGSLRARFSALQRAEIAEITTPHAASRSRGISFSALQRAEIAEIAALVYEYAAALQFQCSSTSRNC